MKARCVCEARDVRRENASVKEPTFGAPRTQASPTSRSRHVVQVTVPAVTRALAWRLSAVALVVGSLASGCDKARSSAPPQPDFSGTWDVAFEDAVQVELRVGDRTLHGRVDGERGTVEFASATGTLALDIDCSSADLVCPTEVFPSELTLGPAAVPGSLDEDGVQLAKPLAGVGRGQCTALPGSFATAEVLSKPTSGPGPEAVALTSGRANVLVRADCFAPETGLPKGSQVILSTGFTAAKR